MILIVFELLLSKNGVFRMTPTPLGSSPSSYLNTDEQNEPFSSKSEPHEAKCIFCVGRSSSGVGHGRFFFCEKCKGFFTRSAKVSLRDV